MATELPLLQLKTEDPLFEMTTGLRECTRRVVLSWALLDITEFLEYYHHRG